MGDLVPVGPSSSGALVAAKKYDPEKEIEEYEKRLKEAQQLEEKLTAINEQVASRIYNVSGSAAGAGSGDFHHYRQVRRSEQERLKRIDEEYRRTQEQQEFELKRKEREQAAEERTAKRRSKRQKKKEKKKVGKQAKGADGTAVTADGAGGSSDSDEGPEQPELD